jgi:hypothetical protein
MELIFNRIPGMYDIIPGSMYGYEDACELPVVCKQDPLGGKLLDIG